MSTPTPRSQVKSSNHRCKGARRQFLTKSTSDRAQTGWGGGMISLQVGGPQRSPDSYSGSELSSEEFYRSQHRYSIETKDPTCSFSDAAKVVHLQ